MAFHIRNSDAERLLRELQALTGETLTDAVRNALAERLEREKIKLAALQEPDSLFASMRDIWARLSLVPNRDPRPDDDILGYGPDGLPQ
ncbi:MAG: type II toxin-antitoxin system VapB family antitoxin [Acidobacteria bacterium]|jgi:antitoxin VapB|nr:type II toxin-antitoxin system VapB family antitoxin [Bryobacteraceae bacterium CoA2 C42]